MVWPLWKSLWRILKKLKRNLQYDPAILHFGICSKDLTSYSTETYSAMFIVTLTTRSREWEQRKCPSTVEYYSAVKKSEIMIFAGK